MEPLYQKHKDEGFAIAAFPCNQFGSQEPGTNAEIAQFARGTHGATYDMYAKINVNGDSAAPLFTFLKKKQGGTLFDAIKWNFSKFLINRSGEPIARYSPTTDPNSIEGDIVKALGQAAPKHDEH